MAPVQLMGFGQLNGSFWLCTGRPITEAPAATQAAAAAWAASSGRNADGASTGRYGERQHRCGATPWLSDMGI
jgi:hypothetical protein